MNLLQKYTVPGPRYTSYPTVPYWDLDRPTDESWENRMLKTFLKSNDEKGISIYIHLPYCESLCTYCACNKRITKNHHVEEPYIRTILTEWKKYIALFSTKPKLAELHLGGGTPTFFSPKNLKILLDEILSTVILMSDADLSFEGHPANTSNNHLETLYSIGFRRVSFGIQDFNEQVQQAIHRFQSFKDVEIVTETARAKGYTSINYDLIYGLPFQTLASTISTIEDVIKLNPNRIAYYSYAHVPWVSPGQHMYTEIDLPSPELKRRMYETGRELLENAGYHEIGMDHFALESDPLMLAEKTGILNRNFMGYTTTQSELIIGLGASSISDCGTGYIQNEKNSEAYIALINNGEWAISRGHLLNREDQIIREHIKNLMCRFETSWECTRLQTDAWLEGLERIDELIADHLVIKEPYKLFVTEKGKNYIRNICMAFDARLWRNLPSTQLFSSTI
jgi:oxygen-independent coproporphyrinogen-3 oxidase